MKEQSDFFASLVDEHDKYEPKVRDNYVRAPFGWPGGKWHSLDYLLPRIPQGKIFLDACGGSGIVTLNSPDWFKLKVFNDRHAGITAFYRCIKDREKRRQMVDWLRLTIHSREEFLWCRDTWESCGDDVERACRWYYMLRTSFSQLGRNWGRSVACAPQQAKALQNSLDIFPVIANRFEQVQVDNLDVIRAIGDYDSDESVIYVDPDYLGANTGIYKHGVDHVELMKTIAKSKGYFMVSGYANDLYDSQNFWTERHTWEVNVTIVSQAFSDTNHLAGKENVMTRKQKATEVLWIKEFS